MLRTYVVGCGGIGPVDGIMIRLKGGWRLAQVGIGAPEDIVGTHLLIGRAVAVEPLGKAEGQRVVGHQTVGTVLPLQFLKLEPLIASVITCVKKTQDEQQDRKAERLFHASNISAYKVTKKTERSKE